MLIFRYVSLILVGFCVYLVNTQCHALEHYQDNKKYPYSIEIEGKSGNLRHIGRWRLFVPVWQKEDALLFANLIGMLDSNHSLEGNFGGGYKQKISDNVLGVYGYYDIRRTPNKNMMSQMTVGVEVLRENIEVRGNIYISPNTQKFVATTHNITATINGPNTYITDQISYKKEVALWGGDIEVGGNLPGFSEFSSYVGYYHFGRGDIAQINGVRLRSEYQINKFLNIHGEVSYDNKRKTSYYGGISLKFSFDKGKQKLQGLDAKMVKMPIRDVDIEVGAVQKEENKSYKLSGRYRYIKIHEVLGNMNKITGYDVLKHNQFDNLNDIPYESIPVSLRQEMGRVVIGYMNNEYDGVLIQGNDGEVIPINLADSNNMKMIGGSRVQMIDNAINSINSNVINNVLIGVLKAPAVGPGRPVIIRPLVGVLPPLPPIDLATKKMINRYKFMYQLLGLQTLPADQVLVELRRDAHLAGANQANVSNLVDIIQRYRQERPQDLVDPNTGYNRLELICEAWTLMKFMPQYKRQLIRALGN